MLTCKKCGAELHEDQKVCIQCGTRTIRGDGFDYDSKKWSPPKSLKIGAGAVALLLLIIIAVNALKVTPPEQVGKEWFSAIADREIRAASKMATPNLESTLQTRGMSVRTLSEEIYNEVESYEASYAFGSPVLQGKTAASIQVTLNRPGDGYGRTFFIDLVKQGRKWRVDSVR